MNVSDLESAIMETFWQNYPPALPRIDPRFSNTEAVEETAPFVGRSWSEIDVRLYDRHSRVLSFMPPDAVPYYFGGLLYTSIRAHDYWNLALDMVSDPESFRKVCNCLSEGQLQTTRAYLIGLRDVFEPAQIQLADNMVRIIDDILIGSSPRNQPSAGT